MKKLMNFKKCLSVIFITVLTANVLCAADKAPGTTVLQFLKMDVSARTIGLGGAFTAVSDDVNSLRYNPAGLRMLVKKEITGTHLIWLEDIRGEYLAYGQPIGKGSAFGISFFYLTADDIERRDDTGVLTGEVGYEQGVVHLGWATRLDKSERVMFGVAAKYAYEVLDYLKEGSVAFDAGFLANIYKNLVLGFSYRNIGIDDEPLPTESRVGLSYLLGDLGVSVDVYQYLDTDIEYAVGLEYVIKKIVAVRLGYNSMSSSAGDASEGFLKDAGMANFVGLSLGFGIRTNPIPLLRGSSVRFDYAMTNFGEIGATHLISFSTEF